MQWIEIGELRHHITIQEKTPGTPLPTGGAPDVWEDLWSDVPANIRQLSAKEIDIARQHVAHATHKVTLRWRPGVKPECRILFKSRIFEIGAVNNPEERNFWLDLTVSEVL